MKRGVNTSQALAVIRWAPSFGIASLWRVTERGQQDSTLKRRETLWSLGEAVAAGAVAPSTCLPLVKRWTDLHAARCIAIFR